MSKAKPEHYVNNKEFTAAISEHNRAVKQAIADGKDKCNEYESCSYFWTRPTNLECILYSSCDTLVDYPLSSGKLFKKKQGSYDFYISFISNYEMQNLEQN